MIKLPKYRGYDYSWDKWAIGSDVKKTENGISINGREVKEAFISLGIVDRKGQEVWEGQFLLFDGRIYEIGYRVHLGPFLVDRTYGEGMIVKLQDDDIIEMISKGEIIGNTLVDTVGELRPRFIKEEDGAGEVISED